MRITRLELRNYKCFEHLILDNLGDRVVIVGPNGCGKSAILESIAAFKEYVASYNPTANAYYRNLPVMGGAVAWPEGVPLPIRGKEPKATISCQVVLSEIEAQLSEGVKDFDVTITIERTGKITVTNSNTNIQNVFKHFDPESGVGVIDYISPDRVFPIQRVTTLSMDTLSLDQQRRERIELPKPNTDYLKFRTIIVFPLAVDSCMVSCMA